MDTEIDAAGQDQRRLVPTRSSAGSALVPDAKVAIR